MRQIDSKGTTLSSLYLYLLIGSSQHYMLKDLLTDQDWPSHRLFPHLVETPRNFLDLGFGTALWCAEVGQENEAYRVVSIQCEKLDIVIVLTRSRSEST